MFRPDANAARFARSAERLALPVLPAEDFVAAADLLVRTDVSWMPRGEEMSLYLRPFMFGATVGLTVRPAAEVTFALIASPVGAYFASGPKPLSIWVSERFSRAAPGGTGAAKFPGNYAGSLASVREAFEHGCDQVVFLDVVERRWVEELGGMNLFFVFDDGTVVTPGAERHHPRGGHPRLAHDPGARARATPWWSAQCPSTNGARGHAADASARSLRVARLR